MLPNQDSTYLVDYEYHITIRKIDCGSGGQNIELNVNIFVVHTEISMKNSIATKEVVTMRDKIPLVSGLSVTEIEDQVVSFEVTNTEILN